jgi:hypothetical protein
MAVMTVPVAVQTVVLDGYDEVRTTRLACPDVTNAPPPRSTFPAAHVAVAVT